MAYVFPRVYVGSDTILELFKAARSFSQGTALAVSKDSLESDS